MMQAAQQWQFDNCALIWRFYWPGDWTILSEGSVGPVVVIIIQVIEKGLAQVLRVEHDHVIQTLAPDGPDQALDKRILPGRTRGDELLFQT